MRKMTQTHNRAAAISARLTRSCCRIACSGRGSSTTAVGTCSEHKEIIEMNTKKCLIALVSAIFITAVTYAQQGPQDSTTEQQLAQRKAELDARENALDKRERILAEKERAIVHSTVRSREKVQAKVQSTEEQAK